MDGQSFHRLEQLFNQALALPAEQRARFLDAACGPDVHLRTAVEELLKHDRDNPDTEKYLASPIIREDNDASALGLTQFMPRKHDGVEVTVSRSWPKVPGYEILAELGRGGMGVVYRVRQLALNRDVAMKMMLPAPSEFDKQLARFKSEAEALARLHHPNIVPIYEIGTHEGRPYFTMEYVAGPNLAKFLAGRPQEVKSAAQLIEILARAIHAVHQCGFVHRDLKPANILLQDELVQRGQDTAEKQPTTSDSSSSALAPWRFGDRYVPKITDFGIAKDQTAARQLTETGAMLGTPFYMAPEQVRTSSQSIGPAADIYALGSILYEMLTGRPPFDAESAAEIITQLVNEEPLSPARLRQRLPADLVTICLKCLEKAPRKRYATAQQLADDLQRFQRSEPIHARPVGMVERAYRSCRRRPLTAALIALSSSLALALIATIVVYSILLQKALNRVETRAEQERQQIVHLHVSMGLVELEKGESFTAILHFSEALQQDEGDPERERVHRMRIAAALRNSPRLLQQHKLGKPILWTRLDAAGGRVATVDPDHSIAVWDLETGKQTGSTLRHQTEPSGGALSPDGLAVATIDHDGTIRVWDVETGNARVLPAGNGMSATNIAFHGSRRALATHTPGASLKVWDLSQPVPIIQEEFSASNARQCALSDDGRWLVMIDGNRKGTIREGNTGKTTAVPWQLDEEVQCCAIRQDGNLIAVVSGNRLRIWEVSAAKFIGSPQALPGDTHQIEFAAAAERVLTLGSDHIVRVWEVRTGQQLLSLPETAGLIAQAHLSPDGKLLLTRSTAHGARLWDVGTGQPLTPSLHHGNSLAAVGFREGRGRLSTVSKDGTLCLWEMPVASSFQTEVAGLKEPILDSLIVKEVPPSIKLANGISIRVAQPTLGAHLHPARVADGLVQDAVFSPNGHRVAVRGEDGSVRIWDTVSGGPTTRPLRQGGDIFCAAFSADGLRLVTAGEEGTIRVWDAVRGEALTQALRPGGTIESVAFGSDSYHAIAFCKGGTAHVLDLSPDDRSTADLVSRAEFLTGNQIDANQAVVPAFPGAPK